MMPRHMAVAFLFSAALAASVRAQEGVESPIYVETDEAEPLLKQAAEAEKNGNWDLAVDKYARVLREHPDSMTPDGKDSKMWRGVRRHVFERISKFPIEGLTAYRTANDAVAKSLFEQAIKEGGVGLERVVNDYFFTSVGDDAAVRLADACAEQGRLEDALHYWELAARLYPSPDVAMAPLVAKWAAACRRAGDEAGWAEAKARLEALGDAPLTIAGKRITAKEAVGVLAKVEPARMRTDRGTDWPRIGGNNAGTRVSDSRSRNDVRLWSFPGLSGEELTAHMNQARQVVGRNQVQVPFLQAYPAVGPGGEVVIADGASVWALSLEDGRELWVNPPASNAKSIFVQAMIGQPRVMSMVAPVIADGRVYVNFLPRQVNMGANNDPTFLAAFALDIGTQLWSTQTDPDPDLQNVWFGSPPVVYGGRVYAAVTSSGQAAPTADLLVLDADTGKLLRKVFLCELRRANPGWGGFLPTEAPVISESGGILFVNTNIGALAAVQAATAEVLWLTEYEAGGAKPQPNNRRWQQQVNDRNGRGLSPIVVIDRRVCFVAGDGDNYMEYDARTGKKILSIPARLKEKAGATGTDSVRWFIGIREERAWFQGTAFAFAIDLSKIDRSNPAEISTNQLTTGTLQVRVSGRGFLSADKFYLPLDSAICVYDSKSYKLSFDAKWQDDTKTVDAGTILLVGDRMLTLSPAGITCFTDRETFDKGYADVLSAANPDLVKLERHAEVLARNPTTYAGAIADYEKIAVAAATSDPVRASRAKTRIMELHLTLGEAAKRSGKFADAIEHFAKAVASAPAEAPLGDVFRDLGECLEKQGQWKAAVAVYQEVIEKYGEKLLVTDAGLARPVRQFAEDKIREIVLEHGLDLYEDVEKKAKDLLEKLKEKGSSDELRKLWENFPNSSSAGAAASLLADRLEVEGRTSEAGLALLEVARRPEAAAGSGLYVARAGELFARAGAWERLEGAAARLERCHATETVKVAGKDMTGPEAAAALRALRPGTASAAERPGPVLWREWRVADADKVRVARQNTVARDPGPVLIVPEGSWAGLDPARVVFVQRAAVLEARDAETDATLWTSTDPRGYLGVTFEPMSDGSTQFGAVVPGGAADRGGIVAADIAEQWNGEVLRNQDQLRRLISASPGKEIRLTVRRKGKAMTLTFTNGRRDADTEPAEPVERLLFADGGLLMIIRAATVQAVLPASGETVWIHCPVHPRAARITHAAAADGRLFLSWTPVATAGQPNPNERDVSLEAIDAAAGRPLWLYRESNSDVTDLFAVSGCGLLVKCERRGVGGHLRLMDVATGVEKRDLNASTIPNSPRLAAALDGGRLVYLREANMLASYDLFTNVEISRDLGGQKGVPDAFAAGGGRAALAYGATRRVILASPNPVQKPLIAPLPDGLPDPYGLGFGGDGVLYVATRRGQAGDRPAATLRKYAVDGADLKQAWKVTLASGDAAEGLMASGEGFVMTWAGNSKDSLAATIRCWQPRSGKLLWEVEPAPDAAGGPLRGAGEQGGTVWIQYNGRLLLFR
ncbi:MAG: PQQ-binding-like beta-propeller repeat protein [Planctomycetota bacterium]